MRMFVLVALGVISGCSSNPTCWSAVNACVGGERCLNEGQCVSRECVDNVCTDGCDDTHPCAAGLFCLVTDSSFECFATCSDEPGGPRPMGDAVCVAGVPTECAVAPTTYCLRCRDYVCPTGTYCSGTDLAHDCVPQLGVGEACSYRDECLSGNCSRMFSMLGGVCQVAAGEPCTDTDCVYCDPVGSEMLCSQSCRTEGDCPSGQWCIGDRTTELYACRRDCTIGGSCSDGYECTTIRELFNDEGTQVRTCLPP